MKAIHLVAGISLVLAAALSIFQLRNSARERVTHRISLGGEGTPISGNTPRAPAAPPVPKDHHTKIRHPSPTHWFDQVRADLGDNPRKKALNEKSLTEDMLNKWVIPQPLELTADDRAKLSELVAIVADAQFLPVDSRFSFITRHVPSPDWKYTIDDLIRFLPEDQISDIQRLVGGLPAGDPRTDMAGLISQRMVRLGIPTGTITEWIGTLEYEEERTRALSCLHEN